MSGTDRFRKRNGKGKAMASERDLVRKAAALRVRARHLVLWSTPIAVTFFLGIIVLSSFHGIEDWLIAVFLIGTAGLTSLYVGVISPMERRVRAIEAVLHLPT